MWLLFLRLYFALTLGFLVIYFFARLITPAWVDVAFAIWCALFLLLWTMHLARGRSAPGARDSEE